MDAYIKNPTASNLYNSTADAIDKEWSSDTCEEFESMLAVNFSLLNDLITLLPSDEAG